MSIDKISKEHWQWVEDMNWHDTTLLEKLALVCSEVGEAINECRGETPTEMLGGELADIVLRVMDIAYHEGISLDREITYKMQKNKLKGNFKGRLK